MKRLKKEFALSDLEVVRRMPARDISIKYAGIHLSRMLNLLLNHSFSSNPKSVMMEFHCDSNSIEVSEPQTHEFNLVQNSESSLITGPTFSGTFSIICHMHNL